MTRYEYNIINLPPSPTDQFDALNKLGNDGWQLVAIIKRDTETEGWPTSPCMLGYFSRPIKNQQRTSFGLRDPLDID